MLVRRDWSAARIRAAIERPRPPQPGSYDALWILHAAIAFEDSDKLIQRPSPIISSLYKPTLEYLAP